MDRNARILALIAEGHSLSQTAKLAAVSIGVVAGINYRSKRPRAGPRDYRGEGNPHARLTWEKVRAIRAERAKGVKLLALAVEYGVDISLICLIASGKRWPEVAAPPIRQTQDA